MRIRSPFLTRLAAVLAVGLLRLLFRTLRVEVRVAVPETSPYRPPGSQRYLYSLWHESLLLPVFGKRGHHVAALVSRHQDGSYVSDAFELVGLLTVRGSTSRGGAAAVRRMLETAKDWHIVITPDGPRGPRRVMKSGIVFLASHSGRAIVPSAAACVRCWRIQGSWTDLVIPKPFTKLYLLGGQPIHVPPDLSREELRRYTALVQDAVDQLQSEADQLAHGLRPHAPAARKRAA